MLAGRFACVVDSCVIASAPKDFVLAFAKTGLFRLVLSEAIAGEYEHTLVKRFRDPPHKAAKVVNAVRLVFADAMVDIPPPLLEGITLPDNGDRHVVAAALVGTASAIVTTNLKDFPAEVCDGFELEVIHPDAFIVNIIDLDEVRAAAAIREMRGRWRNPPRGAAALIAMMDRKGLAQTAQRLVHIVDSI